MHAVVLELIAIVWQMPRFFRLTIFRFRKLRTYIHVMRGLFRRSALNLWPHILSRILLIDLLKHTVFGNWWAFNIGILGLSDVHNVNH